MILQPINDIAQVCAQKGIRLAIICPGSRNAPLTLAFARHPDIACYSVPDERSAAFIGMGMALKTKNPVVLICTSGSAALNFAPAVAEAFFANIPLLILTADRPPEWIGQQDGQTIYQNNVYGKHVKKSFTFPDKLDDVSVAKTCLQLVDSAVNATMEYPSGPVHINVPVREPFYPGQNEFITFNKNILTTDLEQFKEIELDNDTIQEISNYVRIIVVAGQDYLDHNLSSVLSEFSNKFKIPIVADVISNLHEVAGAITTQDLFLKKQETQERLSPDLLITFGKSVISKNLKLFLRKSKPDHWHIQLAGEAANTFLSLKKVVRNKPIHFFKALLSKGDLSVNDLYYGTWQNANQHTKNALTEELNSNRSFNEFDAFNEVLEALPENIDLHLANSMAVRYVNFIGLKNKKGIEVFCNRGTSGIDGSVSTAVGVAMCTDKDVYLLTGDMALFYDRNAFWHNHLPSNLKIIVFNNHGGGIFRLIEGPSSQPELEEFFETKQKLSAKLLAEEFDLPFFLSKDYTSLVTNLSELKKANTSILEIETVGLTNQQIFRDIIGQITRS